MCRVKDHHQMMEIGSTLDNPLGKVEHFMVVDVEEVIKLDEF